MPDPDFSSIHERGKQPQPKARFKPSTSVTEGIHRKRKHARTRFRKALKVALWYVAYMSVIAGLAGISQMGMAIGLGTPLLTSIWFMCRIFIAAYAGGILGVGTVLFYIYSPVKPLPGITVVRIEDGLELEDERFATDQRNALYVFGMLLAAAGTVVASFTVGVEKALFPNVALAGATGAFCGLVLLAGYGLYYLFIPRQNAGAR